MRKLQIRDADVMRIATQQEIGRSDELRRRFPVGARCTRASAFAKCDRPEWGRKPTSNLSRHRRAFSIRKRALSFPAALGPQGTEFRHLSQLTLLSCR